MLSLVLALLFLQTVPSGVIAGTVRGADGNTAAGVRVYAVTLRDATDAAATGSTVFESLVQTDDAGRYRLEVPPGRYYIASGSVQTPTYYPGTAEVSAARPVTIGSGAQLAGIDFSSFVAPSTGTLAYAFGTRGTITFANFPLLINGSPVPGLTTSGSTGTTLSGAIRLSDGTFPVGMEVLAVPELEMAASSASKSMSAMSRARTDQNGRYQLENVSAGNYYILAGTSDLPAMYPGTSNVSLATRVAVPTTPTRIGPLNFVVSGVTISGRVTTTGGVPGIGAEIRLRRASSSPTTGVVGPGAFLSHPFDRQITIDRPDGSFSISGLPPDRYLVEAWGANSSLKTQFVDVAGQSVGGIDFSLPVAMLSGSVLLDTGQPVPNARRLGSVAFRGVVDGEANSSTLFPLSSSGTFSALFEPGVYEIGFPALPSEYEIESIRAGGVDVLKEKLRVTTEPVRVEMRLRETK